MNSQGWRGGPWDIDFNDVWLFENEDYSIFDFSVF